MQRERKDYPRLITPKGVAIWPALNKPDYKFKKETGEYHARIRLDPETPGLAELIETAEKIRDEAYDAIEADLKRQKKGALLKKLHKADVITQEEDPETGELTGKVILRASVTARVDIKNGPRAGESFEKKPDLFDAKGKQLQNPPTIGSGSELKLAVVPMDYLFAADQRVGVRFELEGAQVIKLVTGGKRDADFYGFEEEDGDEIEDQGYANNGFTDESDEAVVGDF